MLEQPKNRCLKCHYDLRGLAIDRDCPECGTPIAQTHLAAVERQRLTDERLDDLALVRRNATVLFAGLLVVSVVNLLAACGGGSMALWVFVILLPLTFGLIARSMARDNTVHPGALWIGAVWVVVQALVNLWLLVRTGWGF